MPVGVGEQVMRRPCAAVEIAVGLVEDQRKAARPRQLEEGAQQRRGILDARGVVGRDQHDGPGPVGDQRRRLRRVGQKIVAGGQVDAAHALHVQPHLVVEIEGQGQDHLVARTRQRRHRRGEGLVAARGHGDLRRPDRATVGGGPLRRQFLAQLGQAEHRAVEMRSGVLEQGLGHGARERLGRGIDRGGLAEVDQRPVLGKALARDPAPRLHHRGRKGPGVGRIGRLHRGALLSRGPAPSSSCKYGRRRHPPPAPRAAPGNTSAERCQGPKSLARDLPIACKRSCQPLARG